MSSKEILGEYAKVAAKLEHINGTLQEMNAVDVAQLIDKIRTVERKMGLVYTLFKSSVYSVSKQNQDQEEEEEQEQEQDQQYHQEQERYMQSHHRNYPRQHQEYQEQDQQHLHQQQQQQQSPSQPYDSQQPSRSSMLPSYDTINNKRSSFFGGVNRPPPPQGRSSGEREEYQPTGDKSLQSLPRR
ncbi:hypothetical protein BGX28_006694, partial [Mortierella sp. GBA30]